MPAQDQPLNRWHFVLAVLIAYGSLYPFDFTLPQFPGQALRAMLTSILWTSKGDVLGNLLLFVPWGLASGLLYRSGPANYCRAALGLALAAILQVLQIALPSRDAALSDIIWNGVGIYVGQFVLAPFAQRLRDEHSGLLHAHTLPLALIALWLATQTLPCIPSLDLALLRANIRAFIAPDPWLLAPFAVTFAGTLVVGHLALTLLPARFALPALAALLPMVLCARLFIVQNTPHWHDAAALLAGYFSVLLLRTPQRIAPTAFAILLLSLTLAGLAPYSWSNWGSHFNWLPFASYLQGNMLSNLRELLETAWHCAALLWLAYCMGARVQGIGVFVVMWVLMLEIIQMWLPGRSADLTPAVTCALIIPLVTRLIRATPLPVAATAPAPRAAPAAHHTPPVPPEPPPWQHTLAWVILCWPGITLLIFWLIHQPGVPYNVRELFGGHGNPLDIAQFVLVLLSLGALPRLALKLGPGALRLPLLLSLASLITLFVLTRCVSNESLDDILGTNNHYRSVTAGIWGLHWAEFYSTHLSAALIAPFERAVRFFGLYLPPAAFLALALAWLELRLKRSSLLALSLVFIPVLWLCKIIAFDWYATDNLVELIEPGGGLWLYLLLPLISANIAFVSRPHGQAWPRLLLTLVCLPVSWFLLSAGLASEVRLDNVTYSAMQFLLGPDRITTLTTDTLMARWAGMYLACVLLGTVGVVIGRRLPDLLKDVASAASA
jgi:VanZ family protein